VQNDVSWRVLAELTLYFQY